MDYHKQLLSEDVVLEMWKREVLSQLYVALADFISQINWLSAKCEAELPGIDTL